MNRIKTDILSVLSLFTSVSTLFCCALPALLVAIGLGAAVAGIVVELPLLNVLTQYKEYLFVGAAVITGTNYWLIYKRPKAECVCEPDANGKSGCYTASRWSRTMLWVSSGFLLIGFFMAYLAHPVLRTLGL